MIRIDPDDEEPQEDWLREVGGWNIRLDYHAVTTLEQLREWCRRQDMSLAEFARLPVARHAPAALRRALDTSVDGGA